MASATSAPISAVISGSHQGNPRNAVGVGAVADHKTQSIAGPARGRPLVTVRRMPRTRLASRFTARLRLLVPVLTACLIALAVAGPSAARADELIHVEVRLRRRYDAQRPRRRGPRGRAVAARSRPRAGLDRPGAPCRSCTALVGVGSVTTPNYALFAAGSVLSEGDEALGAAAARERFGVDGSGVRVAVISDGILGIEQSQERGDAPRAGGGHGVRRGPARSRRRGHGDDRAGPRPRPRRVALLRRGHHRRRHDRGRPLLRPAR